MTSWRIGAAGPAPARGACPWRRAGRGRARSGRSGRRGGPRCRGGPAAFDPDDRDADVVADHQFFHQLASQDQHGEDPLGLRPGAVLPLLPMSLGQGSAACPLESRPRHPETAPSSGIFSRAHPTYNAYARRRDSGRTPSENSPRGRDFRPRRAVVAGHVAIFWEHDGSATHPRPTRRRPTAPARSAQVPRGHDAPNCRDSDRFGLRRVDRGDLRRAGQPGTARPGRPGTGRPADLDDRGGELPRVPGRGHGARS